MKDLPRRPAFWALVAIAVTTGAYLAGIDWEKRLAISPLELIPEDDASREVALIRSLTDREQSRVNLAVIDTNDGRAGEAARAFIGALAKEPAIAETRIPGDTKSQESSGRALFDARMPLLFPERFAEARTRISSAGKEVTPESLAALMADDLDAFLKTDAAYAYDALVPKDPLLLIPRAATRLAKDAVKHTPNRRTVWVRIHSSPLKHEGQQPVFDAMTRAEAAMRAAVPGATLTYTGVNRFAAASEAGIKSEVAWLNGLAVLTVGLAAYFFLRRVSILLHIAVVCGLSLGVAWTVTLPFFGRVHALAVVMGSLLCGVAVDYTLHVLLHDDDAPGPASFKRLKPVLRPLLTGGFIAAGSFAVLLLSPLPAIRQVGGYTTAGILGSLVVALLYGSIFRFKKPDAGKNRESRNPKLETGFTFRGLSRFRAPSLFWLLPLVAGAGFIRWDDNLRQMEYPLPEMRARDTAVREAFGEAGKTVRITTADTFAGARDSIAVADRFFREKTAGRAGLLGPVMLLPDSESANISARFAHAHGAEFASAFFAELKRRDYDAEAFAPFAAAWKQYAGEAFSPAAHEAALAGFCEKLDGPESMLCSKGGGVVRMLTWTDASVPTPEPPAETGTFSLNQLESMNRVFTIYRTGMLHLVLAGFTVIFAIYLLSTHTWESARVLAVPVMSVGIVAGAAGWGGLPLNMFHMLGGFLALCDAFNYALFAWESRREGRPVPVSVRISWATSAGAFGVLGFSSIIALRSLGLTVLAISGVTMLLIHFYPRVRTSSP
jgi:predicted exporter